MPLSSAQLAVTDKLDPLSPDQQLAAASQELLGVDVWSRHRVLVAVSGGADSVALFRTISQLRIDQASDSAPLEVVHVNHGIRAGSADADADFVSKLAKAFGAEFHLRTISWGADGKAGAASENDLRDLRYDAILEVAREIGARYVFTGHHQGDQVETILFRILRGTGLAGLRGIPATRVVDETVSLVRPLLTVDRETILAALEAWGQDFRHDKSNDGDQYSRNFLRNTMLPQVREYFGPHVDQSILRLSQHAYDAVEIEATAVDDFLRSVHWEDKRGPVELPTASLAELQSGILRATLMRLWKQNSWPLSGMTYRHWCDISDLVFRAESSLPVTKNLPGDVRLTIDSQKFRLLRPLR